MEIYENLSIESLPNEEWRDVVGWEGLYQVSNLGRVKSIRRNKMLSPRKGRLSYLSVALCKDGSFNNRWIHRLVYEAFVEQIPKDKEIDHINRKPWDNRLENLRLVTHKENMNNPLTIEVMKSYVGELSPNYGRKASKETKAKIRAFLLSERNPRRGTPLSEQHKKRIGNANKGRPCSEESKRKKSKPILQYSLTGNFIKEWLSATEAANALGLNKCNICINLKGRIRQAYGYIWKYKNE